MKKIIQKLLLLSSLVFSTNAMAYDTNAFIIMVKTDNPGTSAINQFTIPTNSAYTYDYDVDCTNDGIIDAYNQTGNYTCNLATDFNSNPRAITIYGEFPHFYFGTSLRDQEKLLEVVQWGTQQWKSMKQSFNGASNLYYIGSVPPDLSLVTDMTSTFAGCSSLNDGSLNIGDWNVSNVTTMKSLFSGASIFNQDISAWNVSKVTNMGSMFGLAHDFNQDIGDWNVSKVTSMGSMFNVASSFNQDIGAWNVSKVTNMSWMFNAVSNFNKDIGDWNVSKVTSMGFMFKNATNFSQDLGDWNISSVESMAQMFSVLVGENRLSINDYDNMLNSWDQLTLQPNVTLDMDTAQYCLGADAKTDIIVNYDWDINDGWMNCNFYIDSPQYITVQSGQSEVGTITVHGDASNIRYGYFPDLDWTKFTMHGLTGKLSFTSPPDASNPTDKNKDNVYKIRVHTYNTSTQELTARQTIRVKVVPKNVVIVPIIQYLLF